MLRSSAGAEWVSAPTEMKSTPVAAISATFSRVTPPEASSSGVRRRPACPAPTASSRARSGPCCRAGGGWRRRRSPASTSSASRHSTSTGQVRLRLARAPDRLPHPAGDRDVVLLDQDRVVRAPSGGWSPPPAATAAFSSARSPGVVLRVSRMRAPLPSTSRTKRAVSVATPERWPSRLSATRSPASRARAAPDSAGHGGGNVVAPLPLDHDRGRSARRPTWANASRRPRGRTAPRAASGAIEARARSVRGHDRGRGDVAAARGPRRGRGRPARSAIRVVHAPSSELDELISRTAAVRRFIGVMATDRPAAVPGSCSTSTAPTCSASWSPRSARTTPRTASRRPSSPPCAAYPKLRHTPATCAAGC